MKSIILSFFLFFAIGIDSVNADTNTFEGHYGGVWLGTYYEYYAKLDEKELTFTFDAPLAHFSETFVLDKKIRFNWAYGGYYYFADREGDTVTVTITWPVFQSRTYIFSDDEHKAVYFGAINTTAQYVKID